MTESEEPTPSGYTCHPSLEGNLIIGGTHPVRLHLPPLLGGEFDKWNKPFYREGLKTVLK